MNKWFCETCDYMAEGYHVVGSVGRLCPFCDRLMYTLETILQENPDWENYPTVSC